MKKSESSNKIVLSNKNQDVTLFDVTSCFTLVSPSLKENVPVI